MEESSSGSRRQNRRTASGDAYHWGLDSSSPDWRSRGARRHFRVQHLARKRNFRSPVEPPRIYLFFGYRSIYLGLEFFKFHTIAASFGLYNLYLGWGATFGFEMSLYDVDDYYLQAFFSAEFQPIALNQNAEKSSFLNFWSSFLTFRSSFLTLRSSFLTFRSSFWLRKSNFVLKMSFLNSYKIQF